MNKFILEIGIEEIPALYIDNILENMKSNAENILNQYHIDFINIQTFGTPRRLIVYIEDIADRQKNIFQKIKGPSVTVAFDKDGNPQKPALKFAQANQVKLNELVVEKANKGEYLFARKVIKGKKTKSLLPEICLNLISNIDLPKSMRWGTTSLRFIRPIRWLLALYNDKIVSFHLETINSGRITYGHRLLSPESIKINNVDEYFINMKQQFVLIEPDQRKKMIYDQTLQLIKDKNGKEYLESSLLEEVKNLVEYPKTLLGKFEEDYLKLPTEVLTAVMIKHQKYFPIYSKDSSLLPYFAIVINGNEDRYKTTIIQGNERVLKARLEDARFFYQEDQKITEPDIKPLERNIERLKNVIFQENLGTIYDKVQRLIILSQKIAEQLKVSDNLLTVLKRAAQLCKSDLVSEMVKEFPELQGIMGKEYALLEGEENLIAVTIFEHYLPRFSGDSFPATLTGSILSIADKLDNIISCFINNVIPDGSQDPYALRRQSLGIINIILLHQMHFSIDEIIDLNIELLLELINESRPEQKKYINNIATQTIKDFIFQRFRYLLLEKEYKYDVIDAVLAKNPESIFDALLRIKTIQDIYHLPSFNKTITAATRAFNLSKNIQELKIDCSLFQEKEEKILYNYYIEIKERIEKLFLKQQYKEIFTDLEIMNKPIDIFFDKILVMVENEKIRNNRLSLLKSISNLYFSVADLTKIALSKGSA